jgi:hypothetical protein
MRFPPLTDLFENYDRNHRPLSPFPDPESPRHTVALMNRVRGPIESTLTRRNDGLSVADFVVVAASHVADTVHNRPVVLLFAVP